MDSEILAKLPPTRLFFRCAVPLAVTMVFGSLYQIADHLLPKLGGTTAGASGECSRE